MQLSRRRRDEPGPWRSRHQRPHVRSADPGTTEALPVPAAGRPKPYEQARTAPHDDAAGPGQPLELFTTPQSHLWIS